MLATGLLTAGLGVVLGSPAQAASCSTDPKLDAQTVLTASWGTTKIDLRYSPTCRTAWARERYGINGDWFWVYNRDTGALRQAKWSDQDYTDTVDDAGTESHACVQNGSQKVCTGYY